MPNISSKLSLKLKLFIKRMFDIAVGGLSLVLLSPLILFLAFFVRIKLGRPVLFRQHRPGLNGKPFIIYKFRTMVDANDADNKPLQDDQRLLPLGSFLRSTSLDELPELLNVLKGDMSIVGPRPLMMKYLDRYTPEQARRHEVKPGITGWAQINGRNTVSWEDKFRLDVWYVDNWNLLIDFKIILKSIVLVFKRSGISQQGRATVDEFMGTRQNTTTGKKTELNI
jgi:lipopolysaccharide/colanic/teichoic acid biosynthesis glycosyltransferase